MNARDKRRRHPHDQVPADDPLIAPLSTELARHVTHGEDVALNIHQHPLSLWRPVLIALGATLLLVIMLTADQLPLIVLLAFLAAWLYVGWCELERRYQSFAVTTKRVMLVVGLIAKSTPMMRLGKVTDMRLDQSLAGRIFGFGTITIESAGQDQALSQLRFVPFPTETFRRLNETIFGDEYDGPPAFAPSPARRVADFAARRVRRGVERLGNRLSPQPPPNREYHDPAVPLHRPSARSRATTGELPQGRHTRPPARRDRDDSDGGGR